MSVVNGQTGNEVDSLTNKFLLTLKAKNIDTVCIYKSYCIGYTFKMKNEDECDYKDLLFPPIYILWLDNGKTFMTKIDNCFDYSIIELPKNNFWKFYCRNEDTIKKENIKAPEFKVIVNGKETIRSSLVNHSCHEKIKIIINQSTTIDKDLDEYFFEKKVGINNEKNINYEYNVNSFLNKLTDLIRLTIKDVAKNPKFVKSKR